VNELRSRIAAVTLALCASSCDWLKNEVFDFAPPIPSPHPKYDLIVDHGKAYYNGTFIGPGVSVDVWKRALGPPSTDGATAAVWTNLGLMALLARKPGEAPGTVSSFRVAVEVFPEVDPAEMKKAFPGRVMLDGTPLYKGVKMIHVNQFFRNDACKPPGGGGGFNESALPGHYECSTPTYLYSLKVYEERRATFVRYLAVQAR
jgi:hypothetical protein